MQITVCIPAFLTRGKGALGSLLSAPAGASKRETPTSNLTESTEHCLDIAAILQCTFFYILHAIQSTKTKASINLAVHFSGVGAGLFEKVLMEQV